MALRLACPALTALRSAKAAGPEPTLDPSLRDQHGKFLFPRAAAEVDHFDSPTVVPLEASLKTFFLCQISRPYGRVGRARCMITASS